MEQKPGDITNASAAGLMYHGRMGMGIISGSLAAMGDPPLVMKDSDNTSNDAAGTDPSTSAGSSPENPSKSGKSSEDNEQGSGMATSLVNSLFGGGGGAATSTSSGGVVLNADFKPQGMKLNRGEIVQLINDVKRVQVVTTRAIAKKCAEIMAQKRELSLSEAKDEIMSMKLPADPLVAYNWNDQLWTEELSKWSQIDEEIATMQTEPSQADLEEEEDAALQKPIQKVSAQELINVHEYMCLILKQLSYDFGKQPYSVRSEYESKTLEHCAELLVSISVEKKFNISSRDVENAMIEHEASVQANEQFHQATQFLQFLMQSCIAKAKPRITCADYKQWLQRTADTQESAQVFVKNLYEKYNKESKSGPMSNEAMLEIYREFATFTTSTAMQQEEQNLMDLNLFEQKQYYEAFCSEDPSLVTLWDKANGALTTTFHIANFLGPNPKEVQEALSPKMLKKLKKLKNSDIIDMQEMVAQQQRRIVEQLRESAKFATKGEFKENVAVALIQALAGCAVEKRYAVTVEEMAMAGLLNAVSLSSNERFWRANMAQQEILQQVAEACEAADQEGCVIS